MINNVKMNLKRIEVNKMNMKTLKQVTTNNNVKKQTIIKNINETYKIRGENITIKALAKFDVETNRQVFDEKLDNAAINQAFDIYRHEHDIISPKEIKNLRKQYGLSQQDFAALLGISSEAIAIYETGSLPNNVNNAILLDLEKHPQKINAYYKSSKDQLSNKGKKVIEGFLNQERQI